MMIRWLPDLTRLQDMPQRMLDWFDPAHAGALFATFVRYGTWQCPTLSIFKSTVFDDDPSLVDTRSDPNLRYLNLPPLPRAGKPSLLEQDRAIEKQAMAATAMMFRAGVPLLAGTDRGLVGEDPFFVAGFALHDELELMVSAGLPAPAVLRWPRLGSSAGKTSWAP